jgi:site-specific recombinase XerD
LFLARRTRRSVSALCLDDIIVEHVLAFLDSVEAERGNIAATRNCRLAAIRGFVEHLLRTDLGRAAQYQRVLAIRSKRARTRVVEYLEPEYVRAVLAQPDRRTPKGVRDHALLLFLYNTGARISEALAVTADDLHLTPPRHVRLRGKGSKERVCPLWAETASALSRLVSSSTAGAPLFRSARGTPLTRDGAAYVLAKYVALAACEQPTLRRRRVTPHVLRHNTQSPITLRGTGEAVLQRRSA